MALRTGTLIVNPIVIEDTTIPQPAVYADHVQGGAHSGATLSSRDGLEAWHRQWGMFFTVYNDSGNNGTYILKYGKNSTTITDNANWELFAGVSGNNAKKIDQSINGTGSINLPARCLLIAVMINAASEFPNAKVGWTSGNDDLVMQQDIPAGFSVFNKGIWIAQPITIYFAGIDLQSTCSALIIQF